MTRIPNELTDLPDRAARPAPVDLLIDVLAAVRLAGAIFLRAEYTSPWAYESPPSDALTSLLRPGAKRLILFHIIAEGSCWITVSQGDRLQVSEGDVVVLPYGEQHSATALAPASRSRGYWPAHRDTGTPRRLRQ